MPSWHSLFSYQTYSNEEPIIEQIKISSITVRNGSLSSMLCASRFDNVGNKFTISFNFFKIDFASRKRRGLEVRALAL